MSVSEKDAVLRERDAFICGMSKRHNLIPEWIWRERDVTEYAAVRYPLPKVTRPRIIADPHGVGEWRFTNAYHYNTVEQRSESTSKWRVSDWSLLVTSERLKVWADLLANPTEEVEA